MFRKVVMPDCVKGSIYLGGMPGRNGEPMANFLKELKGCKIDRIFSLASMDEIRSKSLSYSALIDHDGLSCPVDIYPLPDFGLPDSHVEFMHYAMQVAIFLITGDKILIHCGAGIGRTSLLAIRTLEQLGESTNDARKAVADAGSKPETDEQDEYIGWDDD